MKPVDENAVLRFASGEMSVEAESIFLAQCEIAPETWRAAVLAVSEHRRLLEALAEVCASEPLLTVATCGTESSHPRWRSGAVAALASLAAGLLLGVMLARMNGLSPALEAPIARSLPKAEKTEAAAHTPVSLDTKVLPKVANPPEAHEAAEANPGFQVVKEPTLYVIAGGDGTRWAVPTQRTTLHYGKQ